VSTPPPNSAESGLTRARGREDTDEAIREVMRLMTSGAWRTGVSHEMLAAKYGVTPHTVSGWATTASRLIRLAIGDGEEAKTRLLVMLEDVHARSLTKQAATAEGMLYDAPDLKAAVSAIDSQAKLLGLHVQRVDMTTAAISAEEWDAWRSAIASELCAGCRERLLERVRAKDPK